MAPCNDGKRAHSCSFPKWINHVPPNSILNQKKTSGAKLLGNIRVFFPADALLTESIWNWSFDTKVNRKYNSLEVVIFLRRFFFSFGYYCCGCCWCVMGSKLRVAVFMIMDFPFSPQEFRLCDMPDCFPQNGRYIFANVPSCMNAHWFSEQAFPSLSFFSDVSHTKTVIPNKCIFTLWICSVFI